MTAEEKDRTTPTTRLDTIGIGGKESQTNETSASQASKEELVLETNEEKLGTDNITSQAGDECSPAQEKVLRFRKVEEGDDQFEAHPTEVVERVREIYYQWCNVYNKDVDADRFKEFTTNFLYMEALANESGDVIEINKWYDCTEEEYNNGLKAELEGEVTNLETGNSKEEENSDEVMGFLPEEHFDIHTYDEKTNVIEESLRKEAGEGSTYTWDSSPNETNDKNGMPTSDPQDAYETNSKKTNSNFKRAAFISHRKNVPERAHSLSEVVVSDDGDEFVVSRSKKPSDGGMKWSDDPRDNNWRP